MTGYYEYVCSAPAQHYQTSRHPLARCQVRPFGKACLGELRRVGVGSRKQASGIAKSRVGVGSRAKKGGYQSSDRPVSDLTTPPGGSAPGGKS